MKRKLFCLTLSLLLLSALAFPAAAAGDASSAADTLFGLGLFQGAGTKADGSPDYALERSLSRQEAITMLVRLLGKEREAKAGIWSTPFTDVDGWAQPYVGYAYANGLTAGMSDTTFGGSLPVTATQYLTFVLRALGYVSGTDFAWDAAWEKTNALGITSGQYGVGNNRSFLRGDAVVVSAGALQAGLKAGAVTLLEQLVADGAVTEAAAQASGLMPDAYTLFAREILAAGKDPVAVSLQEDDTMGKEALAVYFKEYDGFARSAATLEQALADTLKDYLRECMDGDYSDGHPGTPSFRSWNSTVDAFLLTDTKGSIIAYGVRTDKTSKDFTLYFCKINSEKFMDERVKETKAQLAGIGEVPCEATQAGRQYVFRFTDIPEAAVWFIPGSYGSKGNTSNRGYDVERWLLNQWTSLQNGHHPDTPVQDSYTCDAYYSLEMPGTAYHLFYFIDADYNLIGYSLGKIPVSP